MPLFAVNQAVSGRGMLILGLLVLAGLSGCAQNGTDPSTLKPVKVDAYSGRAVVTAEHCEDTSRHTLPEINQSLDPRAIDLLNWNIRKGEHTDWQIDLAGLVRGKELVLIQEARENMQGNELFAESGYWSFAPGFRARKGVTGVATFSQARPISHCNLVAIEPWLRTPKAIGISRFALKGTDDTLVVANLHMINFSLGLESFREQLTSVVKHLSSHEGPVIVSGDFNTWSNPRQQLVRNMLGDLGLHEISFADDKRTRFLGKPVDHVYVAGLEAQQVTSHELDSSDHNPITLRLGVP